MSYTEQYPDQHALKQNFTQIYTKLKPLAADARHHHDLKTVRDKLITLQLEFKNLKFMREDREELYAIFQESFESIHQRIETERAVFEKEAFQNYVAIRELVENSLFAASKEPDPKIAKSYLIEAQNSFKGAKLLKDQREELYNKLQREFDRVNQLLETDKVQFTKEAELNFERLKPRVEELYSQAIESGNFQEMREKLIQLQNEFRGIKLLKDHREQLYQRLQDAFSIVNTKLNEERESFRQHAEDVFPDLKLRAEKLLDFSSETLDFRTARDQLKSIQAELRDSKLFKEQKDFIYPILQDIYSLLNARQDEDRRNFEEEAAKNYLELKKMVEHGLTQAQETTEYKETREYLKKIQSAFKGKKMIKEQREELYSRLQTSFDILNKRVDTFFREKKKNWEIKMQFKANDLQTTLMELHSKQEKDLETLREAETQLDNLGSGSRDYEAKERLMAKILSIQNSLRKTGSQIRATEEEATSIKKRLEEPEEETH